ncbi:VOC family protein [Kitasatospora sp. NPDC002227]|uniref:VOC family protein n=1 Tax=Kitasatospora sp. NPDC002227 TaxID=3154773 RepID=UPI0033255B81
MMKIATAQLWVLDQQEALDFYTKKVGLEVRSDVTMPEMGDFRWLTVGPAGQEDVAIVLMAIPGEPVLDADTGAQLRELTAKGATGTIFLTTEDIDTEYAELGARGIEFTQPLTDMPYGRDFAFQDPSGNNVRVAQLAPM